MIALLFLIRSMPDSLRRLHEAIAQGGASHLVSLARDMHQAGSLTAQAAQLLFEHARTWHIQGLLEEQQAVCEIVATCLPDHFEVLHLLGYGAQIRGEYALAEDYYARALAAKPDYAFAELALAQLRMMRTHFAQGRETYEARFRAVTEGSGPDWRGLPVNRWCGESLAGRKIYLWAEQGLGDIVMFAGFLPYILEQSPARVVLAVFPKLVSLFARAFPAVDVESIDDAVHLALGPSVVQSFPQIEKLANLAAVPFDLAPLKAAYMYAQKHGLFDFSAPMGDMMVYGMPGFTPAHRPAYLKADPKRVEAVRAPSWRKQARQADRYFLVLPPTRANIRAIFRLPSGCRCCVFPAAISSRCSIRRMRKKSAVSARGMTVLSLSMRNPIR